MIKILTVDGGGVRGIIPALVLEYIENEIIRLTKDPEARLSDHLDFVAGTSTGSIITSLINVKRSDGRPKYKLGDVASAYMALADNVFKKDFWRNAKTLWGLIGPKFDSKFIYEELSKLLEDNRMIDSINPCAFAGYDITSRKPTIYTSHDNQLKYADLKIRDVVRGSTSIPAYFPPASFTYKTDGIVQNNTVIDGGVFANNPALVAYIEASKTAKILEKESKVNPNTTFMVSMSTGHSTLTSYKYNKVKKWGMGKWLVPILNILLQGMAEVTNYEMHLIYESYGKKENFLRIDPKINKGDTNASDASKENMENLKLDAFAYIEENKDFLTNIAKNLIK